MKNTILDYYHELFEKHESKTVEEICTELDICKETLRKFLYHYCPTKVGDINRNGLIILLGTKFSANSQYIDIQKRVLHEIKHREYVKMVKIKARECNNIIDQKNKTR